MRRIVLAVILAAGLGISVVAQTVDRLLTALKYEANATQPVESGPSRGLIPSGDVAILVNDVRITADSAVVPFGSNVIELNGGSVRIELPSAPTSIGPNDQLKP